MIIELGNDRYERFSYPGGELQVRFTDKPMLRALKEACVVDILARITKPDQIVELALLKDAVAGVAKNASIHLVVPYLPYARADRRFTEGDCCGIATIARFVHAMSFDAVTCLDIHSRQAKEWLLIKNVSPEPFIEQAISQFAKEFGTHAVNVLLPDEGAVGRYLIPKTTGCNTWGIDVQVFNARKKRDPETGKLSGFYVPEMPVHPTLIVDDICDGGGTFVGIAEQLPFIPDLALYTTHGIYSKGLAPLKMWFKRFYTTNSFQAEYPYDKTLTVMDCVPTMLL